jgi:5'-AMP-activated protein kinase catalytic alpha subunit
MLIVKPEKRMNMAEVRAHRWLQPDIRPYLAMPPLDACMQQQIVDDETVEQAVTRHGFDRSSLLQSLEDGAENEATVAYNLILGKQFDAATRYLWTMIRRHRQAAGAATVTIKPWEDVSSSSIHGMFLG